MSSRNDSYYVLSDEQRRVLVSFYEKGMTSTIESQRIQDAAKEIDVSIKRVKKWIGNYKAKKRQREEPNCNVEEKPKRIKGERKLSARNVFYSKLSREGKLTGFSGNAERNRFVDSAWKQLDMQGRKECEEEAAKKNDMCENYTEEDKADLIKKHKKKMLTEISILEKMGVETALLLLDDDQMFNYGSSKGLNFLASHPNVNLDLQRYLDVSDPLEQPYTYKDLQLLFNTEYAKAVNNKGAKVPYMKGGFEIRGIPDDISWKRDDGKIKKPADYGRAQIKEIMKVKDQVHIALLSEVSERNIDFIKEKEADKEGNNVVIENVANEISGEPRKISEEIELPVTLLKLVEPEVLERAMTGGQKVQEHEVEVLPALTPEEGQEIFSNYQRFFEEEALLPLQNHFKSKELGVVIPTFAPRRNSFWLFYYEGELGDIEGLHSNDTIPGRWLDCVKMAKYNILPQATSIQRVNVITHPDTGIILNWKKSMPSSGIVQVDKNFLKIIKESLKRLTVK